MSENKFNILYKPNIDYEKNYDTIGTKKSEIDNMEITEEVISPADELNKKIESIKKVLPLLPDDLQDLIKNPLGPIENIIGKLPDITDKPNGKEENIPDIEIEGDDFEDKDDEYPDSPFEENRDPEEVEITNKDKSELIEEEYEYDLVSIISDYIDKLNVVTNNYWNNILNSFLGANPNSFPKVLEFYDVNTKKISNEYKHLSDTLIRSQISRSMKQRLYLKMFSLDETITHIRACKAGVEQRIRYYKIPYKNEDRTRGKSSINRLLDNKILEENRKVYDAKYKQNFFNLYKYLNSSVIVFNECVNLFISEAQSKIILIENGEV